MAYNIPEGFSPAVTWAEYLRSHSRLYANRTPAARKRIVDRLRNTWHTNFVQKPVQQFTDAEQSVYNDEANAVRTSYDRETAAGQAAEAAYQKWAQAKFEWDGSLDERGIAVTEDAQRQYELALQQAGLSYDQAQAEIAAQEPLAKEQFEANIEGTRAQSNARGLYRSNVRARNEGRDAENYQRQLDAFARQKKNLDSNKAAAETAARWQKESADRYARLDSADRAYSKWFQERGGAPDRPAPGEIGGAPDIKPFQPTFAAPKTAPSVAATAARAAKKPSWASYLKSHKRLYNNRTGASRKAAVDKLRTSWRGA